MSSREINPKLQALYNSGIPVYSISRLNTFNHCPFEFYLNYIKGLKGHDNVYSMLGGRVHDALESIVHGGNLDEVDKAIDATLEDLDLAGIDFPLDRKGEPTLRKNWITNMKTFAKHFKWDTDGKFETEQFILYQTPKGNYVQGYIDLLQEFDDGMVAIYDWKTSSDFTGAKIKEAGRQLAVYALAKQQEGYDIKKVAWVMLKYCHVFWKTSKGKIQKKKAEWRNAIKEIQKPLRAKLVDSGMSDIEANMLVSEAIEKNSLEGISSDIAQEFTFVPFVREYELDKEILQETVKYIDDTIAEIEKLGEDSKMFSPCDIDKESFYCSSLCGYGGKDCKCGAYADYKMGFASDEDEIEDLFGGI